MTRMKCKFCGSIFSAYTGHRCMICKDWFKHNGHKLLVE